MGELQENYEDLQAQKEITDKNTKSLKAKSTTPKKRVLTTSEKQNAEVYGMLQEVYKKNQQGTSVQPDDFDIFGELVARKVRKLRTPYAQATVQHLINDLLYKAEIGEYDQPKNTETQEQLTPFLHFRSPIAVHTSSTDTNNHNYMSPDSIRSCASTLSVGTYSNPGGIQPYSNPPSVQTSNPSSVPTYEILTSPSCSSNQHTTQIDESWPATRITTNESAQSTCNFQIHSK